MYPTNNEICIAKNVLCDLIKEGFIEGLKYKDRGGYYSKQIYDWYANHEEYLIKKHITINYGETKVCIITNDLKNWVIKVDILRRTNPHYGENYPSYCQVEADNYRCACARGLEGYFAETYAIGALDGLEYFLQERVEIDEDAITSSWEDYFKTGDEDDEDMDRIYDYVCDMNDEERLEAIYGDDKDARRLKDFIEEFEINDLHEGNYGIRKDGTVVIIDYSGYHS